MPDNDTQQLAELIAERHQCLQHLQELGCRQAEYIRAEEMGHLMTVLAAKQRLLAGLQDVERRLDPFRAQDPATRRWSTPAERARCALLASQCETMLLEIVAREQKCEAEMSERRDLTAQRLHHFNEASAARGAYRAELQPITSQLDLSSET